MERLVHEPSSSSKTLELVGVIRPNLGAQRKVRPLVHDLTRPLPFQTNTISAIYGSHVLEHLYHVDAQRLLAECKRVLKPGGVLWLVVPDLRSMVSDHLKKSGNGSQSNVCAADELNERLGYKSPAPNNGNAVFKFYAIWKDFHSHKWMYDSESLKRFLLVIGFKEAAEKQYRQSDIVGIEEVGEADRVLNGAGVCVEAKKPGLEKP